MEISRNATMLQIKAIPDQDLFPHFGIPFITAMTSVVFELQYKTPVSVQ